MADVATHVRIFEPDPSDDFVTKRTAAVTDLASQFGKDTKIDTILSISEGIAAACSKGGMIPQTLATLVEAAVKSHSTSFIRQENELQLLVIALLALHHQIMGGKQTARLSISDVFAYSTWLALAFQAPRNEPKLEALRREVLLDSRTHCRRKASHSRVRTPVNQFKIEKLGDDASQFESKLKSALEAPLNALRNNSILDREEIDFLWWALSDYSSLLNAPLSSLPPPVAAIAAAVEAARNLRRVPADSHKHIVLRHVRESPALNLQQLLDVLGPARSDLGNALENDRIDSFPGIFALLAAIKSGKVTPGTPEALPLTDWAARALLESGFLNVLDLLPEASV